MCLARMQTILILALIFLGGCGSSTTTPPPAQSQPPTFEYRIGTGDQLEIFVWKYPELTRQMAVRSDGRIALPLIGDTYVQGMKPDELEKELVTKFSEFVLSPVVTVSVLQINSLSVLVRGEVNGPGLYKWNEGMTLLELITMAGDFSQFADKDDITIVRRNGDNKQVIKAGLEDINSSYEPIYIQPGDIVVVGN